PRRTGAAPPGGPPDTSRPGDHRLEGDGQGTIPAVCDGGGAGRGFKAVPGRSTDPGAPDADLGTGAEVGQTPAGGGGVAGGQWVGGGEFARRRGLAPGAIRRRPSDRRRPAPGSRTGGEPGRSELPQSPRCRGRNAVRGGRGVAGPHAVHGTGATTTPGAGAPFL